MAGKLNEVAEYGVKILKEYSEGMHCLPRSTTDLSPLEQWLIVKMYEKEGLWKRAINQVNKWRFFNKGIKRLEFIEKEESVERDNYLNELGYIKIKGNWYKEIN